jgi:hypothetical protein
MFDVSDGGPLIGYLFNQSLVDGQTEIVGQVSQLLTASGRHTVKHSIRSFLQHTHCSYYCLATLLHSLLVVPRRHTGNYPPD